ncbi:MAG: GNAT family N-acetyltransferase [Actinomycetota bacterium]|nr:GNAT family N-acetyltransferase [Actinomycetota bacterium]
MWRRSDEALGLDPEPASSFLRWILGVPFVHHDRDTVIIERGDASVGLGVAMRDPASVGSGLHWFGVVDPAHHGQSLGAWLVSWADVVVRQRKAEQPFDVRTMCPAADDAAHRLFGASGYEQVRLSWDMAIELTDGAPPIGELPAGVQVRTFETGRDERTLWEVEESAFAEHFGFAPSPYESFEAEWYRSEDWDPSRVLLAEVGGRVVGELAWFDAKPDGYIANLGVLKEYRRRGIAKTLLKIAFADAAAAGFERATLSVDTENATGAVALYRAVGMEPIRESHVFQHTGS